MWAESTFFINFKNFLLYELIRANGGIGRHVAFRTLWEQSRGGSSPLSPTKKSWFLENIVGDEIFVIRDTMKNENLCAGAKKSK